MASIRTLGKITWIAWVGLVCIMLAGEKSRILSEALPSNAEVL